MSAAPTASGKADFQSGATSSSSVFPWSQQALFYALVFVGLMLLHAPLLHLPYFWDEAGYYVPAARDLFLKGLLIPQSTPSNAHPPLVMAWIALAWRIAGFAPVVTRTAMLTIGAFTLLGLFRLARCVANTPVAIATTVCTGIYPVFFAQSSLAHVDLAAAGFTFWGLLAFAEDRPWQQAIWFALAALAKETAILAPIALFGWLMLASVVSSRWPEAAPPAGRRTTAFHLLIPLVPLAGWYAFHLAKTGYLLGNPEFFRYNVAATLSPFRIPLALGLRLWQIFGYFGLWLLTVAGLLAMFRPARGGHGEPSPRIAIWIQIAFLAVLLAYVLFMSVVGGAVLARYMLPVVPLAILVWVSTLYRRLRYWKLIVALVAIAFVAGLFTNPPYGFSLEDNLAYRDYILLHVEADNFLAMRFPRTRVLTAWPASDELSRPWLGYVREAFPVVRIEDFSGPQVARAAAAIGQYDVTLVFSTKYQPDHAFFDNWRWWEEVKERYFGYHRDLPPEEIASQIGGRVLFRKERNGQWVAVIGVEREENAELASAGMRLVQNPSKRSELLRPLERILSSFVGSYDTAEAVPTQTYMARVGCVSNTDPSIVLACD